MPALITTASASLGSQESASTDSRSQCPTGLPRWLGPQEVELGTSEGIVTLAKLAAAWRMLPPQSRGSYLRGVQFSVSTPPPRTERITLLPGGVVAMYGPEGLRVPDPLSTVTFNEAETRRVKARLRHGQAAVTLIHAPEGVVSRPGIPADLPPQSVTIVAHPSRLPKLGNSCCLPAIVQWGLRGGVAWSLTAAPPLLSLAAHVAATPVENDGAALPADIWAAADIQARSDMIAAGVAELVDDCLAGTACEDLRSEIIGRCARCLALPTAQVLSTVPACFQADATHWPGELPGTWHNGMALLRKADLGRAMLGIDGVPEAQRVITALRDNLSHTDAVVFLETGSNPRCSTVQLDSAAADFLVRRAGVRGRIGVLLSADNISPVELYCLANGIAYAAGSTVTAVAPCWGLCHRVTIAGEEAGNASWFGMGAGLDELDVIAATDFPAI